MTPRNVVALATLVLAVCFVAPAQDTEQRVTVDDLPAAVKKTVLEVSKGLKLRGLTREVEAGKIFYEAELDVNGRTRDVTVDPTGAIVMVEEEVDLSSVPAAVREAIEKGAGGGKIELVESITRNNQIEAYEAHIRKAGKTLELKVAPDGKPIVEK